MFLEFFFLHFGVRLLCVCVCVFFFFVEGGGGRGLGGGGYSIDLLIAYRMLDPSAGSRQAGSLQHPGISAGLYRIFLVAAAFGICTCLESTVVAGWS